MRRIVLLSSSFVLAGCPDQSLNIVNNEPEVAFTAPAPEATFGFEAAIELVATVRDPQSPTAELELFWSTDQASVLVCDEVRVEDQVTCTVPAGTFPEGRHLVTLRAVDSLGAAGEATVPIVVAENVAPTAAFLEPLDGAWFRDDRDVPIRLQASDPDAPRLADLTLSWSGLDATLPDHPDVTGAATAAVRLPPGAYTLTVDVFDVPGESGAASVSFTVFDHLEDLDEDGYRDEGAGGDDCDDGDPDVHPGAAEICDLRDQDCDGSSDEDAQDATLWYRDQDLDTWGVATETVRLCRRLDEHWSTRPGDCDDTDPDTWPGAPEIPYDGRDQDCASGDECDLDGDSAFAAACGGPDCDDDNPDVNPDAEEVPYNGLDDDCLEGDACDLDGDGFDAPGCGGPDCDDDDPSRWSRGPITVPTESPTIQGAIDALCDGGVVNVEPGWYRENLSIHREVEVIGASRGTVTIDGASRGSTVLMSRGALRHLTICLGRAIHGGGVSVVDGLGVEIDDVSITENTAQDSGGGLYIADALGVVTVTDVDVTLNLTSRAASDTYGGGVRVIDSPVVFERVLIAQNRTQGIGGGLRVSTTTPETQRVSLVDVTVARNQAAEQGGVSLDDVEIDGLVLDDNVATTTFGAGVIEGSDGFDLEVVGNQTASSSGIGLVLRASILTDVEVVGNTGGRETVRVEGNGADVRRIRVLENTSSIGLSLVGGGFVGSAVVAGNSADGVDVGTGGAAPQRLQHFTIVGNGGTGLRFGPSSDVTVTSGIIAFNGGNGMIRNATSTAAPRYTDVFGHPTNWTFPEPSGLSNSAVDPRFRARTGTDATTWDLGLAGDSPLLGHAEPGLGGAADPGAYGGPDTWP